MREAPFNLNSMCIKVLDDVDAGKMAELNTEAVKDGKLQVMPAAFYEQFSQDELSAFCVKRGLYGLPTTELVEFLRNEIGGRSTIEIGCGSGALGRALGVLLTDSKMQEVAEIKAHYESLGQAVITYPDDVVKLTALQAVEEHRPEVVVASWVTHKYRDTEHHRGGNQWGVDEEKLLSKKFLRAYIHVGNVATHRMKKILEHPHETFWAPWLFSRSTHHDKNVIWIWRQ